MKELFESLGAGEKEMQAFLKMLELGAQPISIIAKFVGVPRSSMYVILDRLKALHLVEEFEQKNIKYVRCIPVENLKNILESKEKQLEQTLVMLGKKLPELENLENRLSITPKVKFHEGKEGVMQVYE
ncbi:MAG: helix-turn-helix domain-containing protein, partial [Candidatus Gracilibacteria bacterium]